MEEIREDNLSKPIENAVPDERMPGLTAEESKEKSERQAQETPDQPGSGPTPQKEPETDRKGGEGACQTRGRRCHWAHLIFDLLLLAAVITLFVLHFTDRKPAKAAPPTVTEQVGDGSVVYVNLDTINDKYEMVSLLTDSIDAEKQRQTVQFQNRQKALENKLANYQRNMQSGQLTAQQAQYAEASLQQESQKLQSDYAQAVESLEARYTAALEQIADSLRAATLRVNAGVNASFVLTYGSGSPMICADPSRDITGQVLEELNKPFTKKNKK